MVGDDGGAGEAKASAQDPRRWSSEARIIGINRDLSGLIER